MKKDDVLDELALLEGATRTLVNKLATEWQLIPGDQVARDLRQVCDTVGNALSDLGHAACRAREMGEW